MSIATAGASCSSSGSYSSGSLSSSASSSASSEHPSLDHHRNNHHISHPHFNNSLSNIINPYNTSTTTVFNMNYNIISPEQYQQGGHIYTKLLSANGDRGGGCGYDKVVVNTAGLFSNSPVPPADFEDRLWGRLKSAIRDLFEGTRPRESRNKLYEVCDSLCVNRKAKSLYSRLLEEFESFVATLVKSLVNSHGARAIPSPASSSSSAPALSYHQSSDTDMTCDDQIAEGQPQLLKSLTQMWTRFTKLVWDLSVILVALDKGYASHTEHGSLRGAFLWILRRHMLREPALLRSTYDDVLRYLYLARMASDESVLVNSGVPMVLIMLDDLELHHGELEDAILSATASFYATEASDSTQKLDAKDYIQHVEKRLTFEESSLGIHLRPGTLDLLKDIVLHELVEVHRIRILCGRNAPPAGDSPSRASPPPASTTAVESAPVPNSASGSRDSPSTNAGTKSTLGMSVIGELIAPERGIYKMLLNQEVAGLHSVYCLIASVDRLDFLKRLWSEIVKAEGARLIKEHLGIDSSQNDSPSRSSHRAAAAAVESHHKSLSALRTPKSLQKQLIPKLVDLKRFLSHIQATAFEQNDAFQQSLKDAWETFLNATPELSNYMAALLAKYCDEIFRSPHIPPGQTVETDDLTNSAPTCISADRLDDALTLFRFLQSKDFFEAYYKKDLSKRLLLGKSSSEELEKRMIQKLKDECGAAFTSKMKGMLKELDVSRESLARFQKDKHSKAKVAAAGIQFECYTLAASIWPYVAPTSIDGGKRGVGVAVTPQMATLQSIYTEFYQRHQKGRNLTWIPSMGNCVVRAAFALGGGEKKMQEASSSSAASSSTSLAPVTAKAKKHDLVVSQLQCVCLMLFNEANSLSIEEFSRATGLEPAELHRQLLALYIDPKRRVLNKIPARSKECAVTDVYSVNEEFSSKLTRIVINQIQLKETAKEVEDTEGKVEEDRSYHTDALIIRLMKAKKSYSHNGLIGDVLAGLKFKATAASVKQRIEYLIEREFLERDTSDPQLYKYLA